LKKAKCVGMMNIQPLARANRTIMECARNMILAQGLELEFWGEAVNTAVYIKN
jgi:hypothetical protein